MNFKFVEFKDLPNISVNTTVDVIAVIKNISDLESIVIKENSKEYKKRDISLLDTNSFEVWMTGALKPKTSMDSKGILLPSRTQSYLISKEDAIV